MMIIKPAIDHAISLQQAEIDELDEEQPDRIMELRRLKDYLTVLQKISGDEIVLGIVAARLAVKPVEIKSS